MTWSKLLLAVSVFGLCQPVDAQYGYGNFSSYGQGALRRAAGYGRSVVRRSVRKAFQRRNAAPKQKQPKPKRLKLQQTPKTEPVKDESAPNKLEPKQEQLPEIKESPNLPPNSPGF